MSIHDINNAAAAMNALKVRYEDFLDDADDQIMARQAAYDGLAGNLKSVVSDEMYFNAVLDPDEVAPTNVENGTFNDLQLIFNAAPAASFVRVYIPGGKTFSLTSHAETKPGQMVYIVGPSSGRTTPENLASFVFASYEEGAVSKHRVIRMALGSHINFDTVRLVAEPRVNAAPFESTVKCITPLFGGGQSFNVGLYFCQLEGNDDGAQFVGTGDGNHVSFSSRSCSASGLKLLDITSSSTARIATFFLTLSNNAVLQTGGTQGVNMIGA